MSVYVAGQVIAEVTITVEGGGSCPAFSTPVETSYTSSDGGHLLQAPVIQLRVGRGVFRPADLAYARTAVGDRSEAVFQENRTGKLLHLMFSSFRAGAPFAPVSASLRVNRAGPTRSGTGDS